MKNRIEDITHLSKIARVPKEPGIYAMYDKAKKVVYVGASKSLRERIQQHIINRDSSVTTGVSATVLNPDKISYVQWWIHDEFSRKKCLKAAEYIAFEVLRPILRSRENVSKEAEEMLNDSVFSGKMKSLFSDKPSGKYVPKTLDNLWDSVLDLVERVSELEKRTKI